MSIFKRLFGGKKTVGWYEAIHRERGGEAAGQEALYAQIGRTGKRRLGIGRRRLPRNGWSTRRCRPRSQSN